MHIYVYVNKCIRIHIYIYKYVYTYISTHARAHTHTHTQCSVTHMIHIRRMHQSTPSKTHALSTCHLGGTASSKSSAISCIHWTCVTWVYRMSTRSESRECRHISKTDTYITHIYISLIHDAARIVSRHYSLESVDTYQRLTRISHVSHTYQRLTPRHSRHVSPLPRRQQLPLHTTHTHVSQTWRLCIISWVWKSHVMSRHERVTSCHGIASAPSACCAHHLVHTIYTPVTHMQQMNDITHINDWWRVKVLPRWQLLSLQTLHTLTPVAQMQRMHHITLMKEWHLVTGGPLWQCFPLGPVWQCFPLRTMHTVTHVAQMRWMTWQSQRTCQRGTTHVTCQTATTHVTYTCQSQEV